MTVDFEGYESLYDYLLSNNKQYVDLLKQGISHQQMIDEKLLSGTLSIEELREAEKEHLARMAILRREGRYCQVCEGKPCNIQEVAKNLISQIRFTDSDDNEPGHYDISTKAGYLQQRASNRHNLTNYEEIIHELPGCCLGSNFVITGNCDDHFAAYSSIKQAVTF